MTQIFIFEVIYQTTALRAAAVMRSICELANQVLCRTICLLTHIKVVYDFKRNIRKTLTFPENAIVTWFRVIICANTSSVVKNTRYPLRTQ